MTANRRSFLKQLGLGVAGLNFVASSPLCLSAAAAGVRHLPRGTPETQGVSSAGILAFLSAVGKSKHEFHSFMMVRHGHVIAEGWWAPYRKTARHMLYSLSKSFTSTAVGFAVTEGRLTVEDSVTSLFPDDLPATVSDNLAALRVKHLLTMSVGHAKDSTPIITKEQNWVKSFLSLPIENAPGSTFLYNSGATYMLSAIVQKLSGQKVIDYLPPAPIRAAGHFRHDLGNVPARHQYRWMGIERSNRRSCEVWRVLPPAGHLERAASIALGVGGKSDDF